MFREMRRKDRAIPEEEAYKILTEGEYGVLSVVNEDGQPYGVPISYIVSEGHIYFHCAHTGHKMDCLEYESRCSFAVIGRTQPIYDKNYTTYFESVIAFGTVTQVTDPEEKTKRLIGLVEKYLPEHMDKIDTIPPSLPNTCVLDFKIQHITGKAKRLKAKGALWQK